MRVDLQEKVADLEEVKPLKQQSYHHTTDTSIYACSILCDTVVFVLQDLQESEVCQDELALRVKQLKADLVLFKGLMSNVSSCQSSFELKFLITHKCANVFYSLAFIPICCFNLP